MESSVGPPHRRRRLDFDELIRITEEGHANQSARWSTLAKCPGNYLPSLNQIPTEITPPGSGYIAASMIFRLSR